MPGINSFEDLIVWQKAKDLALLTYKYTRNFPDEEKFGLTAQMRRAAISITSNIAEGFGRVQSKDKEHFYVMAAGSLSEVLSQFIIAQELGYISKLELQDARNLVVETRKLMIGLLKSHRG